jgi:hypothetical protein
MYSCKLCNVVVPVRKGHILQNGEDMRDHLWDNHFKDLFKRVKKVD